MIKNNKGFVLTEILILSAIVIGVLTFMFIQFKNINRNYQKSLKYDTVQGLYLGNIIMNYINDDNYDELVSKLNDENLAYIDLTNCDVNLFETSAFCEELFEKSNVEQIIFTEEGLNSIKSNLGNISLDNDMKEYIKTIKTRNLPAEYRIIIKYADNTFTTMRIKSKIEIAPVIPIEPCNDGLTNINDYEDFEYSGDVKTFNACKNRRYKLEVWGAEGGRASGKGTGGKGGYAYGTLNLTTSQTLYIYVGGKGLNGASSTKVAGGYNGGGSGGYNYGASGGGATDIRVDANSDEETTLYERIIVAGGGGGGANYDNATGDFDGGAGGGTSGIDGTGYAGNVAHAGTQTSGGTASYASGQVSYKGEDGSFGTGGTTASQNISYNRSGGGGGGWYGGAGGSFKYNSSSYYNGVSGGGGGSGYVYTSETASNYPSGCLLNDAYYLTDASTVAGNTSFTSPTGTSETGHSENGFARITYIGNN